jgi:integrase
MARRVHDKTLDSRDARSRLKIRGKPYYRTLERGLHLGYRRLGGGQAGTWVARHYVGDQQYEVERIGTADDKSDADGVAVLDFWQAQDAARKAMVDRVHRHGKHGPYTVGRALDDYLEFLSRERKTAKSASYGVEALIRPKLGDIEVARLTTERVERWRNEIADTPARIRTRPGLEQVYKTGGGKDAKRARRATANRQLTVLKAALNRAWKAGKVGSNAAWARVAPFRGVNVARVRYLSIAEAQRLTNACGASDFRLLVQAALQTGARLGELVALQVHDFNRDASTIAVRDSKSGKPRHILLTEEGAAFFRQVCAGRPGYAIMLPRADGQPWGPGHQREPMLTACKGAQITPPISFHGLRHTWASLAVMGGVPLMVVARNLGHADTRMVEKYYGHLAPSYVADAIRAGAPRFGFEPDTKVAALRR